MMGKIAQHDHGRLRDELGERKSRRQETPKARRGRRLHRNGWRQGCDGSQGVHSACDPSEQTQESAPDIDIRTLGEDKKWKPNKASVHPGDECTKPRACDTAD